MDQDWWSGTSFGLLVAGAAYLGAVVSAFLLGETILDELTVAAVFVVGGILSKAQEPESDFSDWFDRRSGTVLVAVFVTVLLVDTTL